MKKKDIIIFCIINIFKNASILFANLLSVADM